MDGRGIQRPGLKKPPERHIGSVIELKEGVINQQLTCISMKVSLSS